ncbi:MAG: hypothetical protein AABZ44_03270 [Elusimicrobiota bacterium]
MRKRTKVWLGALGFTLALAGAVMADKDHKGKEHHDMVCPMKIAGAQVRVNEIESGVVIHITSEDPVVIKKIQITASQMLKQHAAIPENNATAAATYTCPMGCYTGPKTQDGRCPKCGMNLKKR